ncbi:MAG: hypothetical protein H7061_01960 [Bdellovibrionaceae bacterium]|nr:hypothetical protein [Bdellovibrio sp.]
MTSKLTPFFAVLTLAIGLQVQAAPTKVVSPTTKDVTVAINEVYIPGGFDSKADAYVVISGIFPNGCYKWKGATRTDVTKFEHEVTASGTVGQGMCLMVLVPFSKDVRLGQLDAGTHTLRFMSNDGTFIEKQLVVEQK